MTTATRHDLVWLDPMAARAARVAGPIRMAPALALNLLGIWLDQCHPLIVTRQQSPPAGPDTKSLAVGLALPPARGKHRIAFVVPAASVRRHARPPTLAQCRATLPDRWHRMVDAILGDAALSAMQVRVGGSAAMEHLTGLPCLEPGSDLDLLVYASSWPQALCGAQGLARLDGQFDATRLDGEILAPDGSAVAWRELQGRATQLLVKRHASAEMVDRAQLDRCFGPLASTVGA